MASKKVHKTLFSYIDIVLILGLVLIDRITKLWAENLPGQIDFGLFALTYVTNSGAGFSLLQGANLFLIILSVIIAILIIYYAREIPKISIVLILSGLFGNLIDRVSFGYVIDFINLKLWPIFNIADTCIFLGVVYFGIILFLVPKNVLKKRKINYSKSKKRN